MLSRQFSAEELLRSYPVDPTLLDVVSNASLPDLMERARDVRDRRHGTRITYSPKVFIPLTMLCRDKCGYCTFAQPPARLEKPYLLPEEVLAIARSGARLGCHEALFTLGERPSFATKLLQIG